MCTQVTRGEGRGGAYWELRRPRTLLFWVMYGILSYLFYHFALKSFGYCWQNLPCSWLSLKSTLTEIDLSVGYELSSLQVVGAVIRAVLADLVLAGERAGVSNRLASLAHSERRRVVLGHTLNTFPHVITRESHNVLSKFMILWFMMGHIYSHPELQVVPRAQVGHLC